MMNNILISVIVPTFNIENYIENCVSSLLNQSFKDFEILLINDGSTDNSGAICDKMSESDPRISVIHKENGGLSSARNAGVSQAKGDYIIFLDGDDRLTDGALEKLSRIVSNYDNPDIVQFKYLEVNKDGEPLNNDYFTEKIEVVTLKKEKFQRLYTMGGVAASSCTKLISKQLFANLRFKEGIIHEDEYIVTDLLSLSDKIVYLDAPLYLYYFRQNSIITSNFSDKKLDLFTVLDHRIEVLKNFGYEDLLLKEYIRIFNSICLLYPRARHSKKTDAAKFMKAKLNDLPNISLSISNTGQKWKFRLIKNLPFLLDIIFLIKKIIKKI